MTGERALRGFVVGVMCATGLTVIGVGASHIDWPQPSSPAASSNDSPVVVVEVTPTPTPTPTPTESALSECPTEDSVDCQWDASEQGNGIGTDPDPIITEPEKGPSGETPVIGEAEGPTVHTVPCEPGAVVLWNLDGTCSPMPSSWPYSTGETLVCGLGAKPALDYREDVGWWAYCEPALVQ